MPKATVDAGLFSFLGDQVYAQTQGPATEPSLNLQNIALLQARDYPSSEDSASDIVGDTSLLASVGPLGATGGDANLEVTPQDTSVYVVKKGDTLSSIANMFGVSTDTVLWANNMKKGDKLVEGDVLFILPVSGFEYTVQKGDTLASIAKKYKADVNDIAQFNDLPVGAKLAIGDELILPDAQKSVEGDKPVANLAVSIAKDKAYYANHPIQNLAGYFIDPVPGYRKSQGIHDNNAVDLAIGKGTPIHAAAAGKVKLARSGYNGGFGNLVIISHPNGTETLYAHQSKLAVSTGADVFQGQIIGYVGSTGHSTGPHLHFEVHGARNPGTDGSWKY